MTSPNLKHEYVSSKSSERSSKRFGLTLVYLLVGVILIGGSSISFLTWQLGVRQAQQIAESIAYDEFLALKNQVDIDTYYQGLSIEGIPLGGLTRSQAADAVAIRYTDWQTEVAVDLQIDDQKKTLSAAEIGWQGDVQVALERAWAYGRTSELTTEAEQVRERYETIQKLQTEPVNFKVSQTYDKALTVAAVRTFVSSQQTAAKPATATGFNFETNQFIVEERVIGRRTDPQIFQELVISALDQGQFQAQIAVESDKTEYGMTREMLLDGMTLVATANTFAYKVDPERDNNLLKASDYLNGTIIQPGATFSFNESVGQRTAERGFMEAGAISDGILKKELGGGVCQVNTTVMQATMKSDFQLKERFPHSWPSSYTKIGLDATVDWGGVDFKFTNDSDYPVAIVASYIKPKLSVNVYGRRLEEGVTITLRSEETEVIPAEPPIYRSNNTLKPGEVVEVRAPHDGKRAIAYKVYKKGTVLLREEVLFKSYYRPIQGLYDVGPAVPSIAPTTVISAASGLND
ncbi:MAG: VanW family protein [Eubacteriales bacterium]|nr:VanW family protein [Eubacteriales bacterium]